MNNIDLFTAQAVKIHLHVQQRTTRQKITLLSGLPETVDARTLVKKIKRQLCCSGTITENGVIQFSGDQRNDIAKYLIDHSIAESKNIIIHGY